jgi:hypothetical protein
MRHSAGTPDLKRFQAEIHVDARQRPNTVPFLRLRFGREVRAEAAQFRNHVRSCIFPLNGLCQGIDIMLIRHS